MLDPVMPTYIHYIPLLVPKDIIAFNRVFSVVFSASQINMFLMQGRDKLKFECLKTASLKGQRTCDPDNLI